MVEIEQLQREQAETAFSALVSLLQDAVDSGGSLGFWSPMSQEEAAKYWQGILADLPSGYRILLVARRDGEIVGSVQLELSRRTNGAHRAEVQKLIVHRAARGSGIGLALLKAVEDAARKKGRSLLFLDTRRGDVAEQLYQKHGYTETGIIPKYVLESDGSFSDTVIFCREI